MNNDEFCFENDSLDTNSAQQFDGRYHLSFVACIHLCETGADKTHKKSWRR